MSQVVFSSVSKSFVNQCVLDNATFSIPPGARVGLVGENGGGKSTILRLITGDLAPDSGNVTLAGSPVVHHVEQLVDLDSPQTAFAAVMDARPRLAELRRRMLELEQGAQTMVGAGGYTLAVADYADAGGFAFEGRAHRALAALGLAEQEYERPLGTLSGGECARVALARAVLSEADVLLLDEPDNHLDLDGLNWLEATLGRYSGTLVIVSHDRELLEGLVDMVVEVEDGRVACEQGGLDDYLARKRAAMERLAVEYREQQRRVAKLEADIRATEDRARSFDNKSTHDFFRRKGKKIAKTALVRKRRLERELSDEQRIDKPRDRARIGLRVAAADHLARHMLRLEGVEKSFDGRRVLAGVSLALGRGECLAVTGPNGSGKTTLVETALGLTAPDSGEAWLSAAVPVFYCDQRRGGLDPERSVYDTLAGETDLTPNQVYYLLAKLGLKGMGAKPVGVLSGGERTRVVLAVLMNTRAGLLALDEPTNHLDLPSMEVLEEALRGFPGGILLVSHDRRLVNNVATRVVELRDGRLHDKM